MNPLLIGNILCFIGAIIMTLMGFLKKRRSFIAAQSGMSVFFIAGNIFLGGMSGAVANFSNLIRNLVCLKWKLTTPLKLCFIALNIGLTAYAGSRGIIMWLPVIGNCVFTWFLDTENMILLKALVIICQLLWAIYDLNLMNYATLPFDIAAVVTNSVSAAAILRERRK